MYKDAVISDCGLYRYSLSRVWDDTKPMVNFIMLNPSKADGKDDDPTVRRCINFAKYWGYGGLIITNLFAFRATKQEDMFAADDPFGPDNMAFIDKAFAITDKTICAWGTSGGHRDGDTKVLKYMVTVGRDRFYLTLTKEGYPGHPLFLPKNLIPFKL